MNINCPTRKDLASKIPVRAQPLHKIIFSSNALIRPGTSLSFHSIYNLKSGELIKF